MLKLVQNYLASIGSVPNLTDRRRHSVFFQVHRWTKGMELGLDAYRPRQVLWNSPFRIASGARLNPKLI